MRYKRIGLCPILKNFKIKTLKGCYIYMNQYLELMKLINENSLYVTIKLLKSEKLKHFKPQTAQ